MSSPLYLLSSSCSELGRRSSNDDAILVDSRAGLYVICDGARGRFGGRNAAELACQTIKNQISELMEIPDQTITPAVQSIVEFMLQSAHQRILTACKEDPSLQGMTSTVAMVVHRGAHILVSHVGDSRVYFYRETKLKQLTIDHNLGNYLQTNPQAKPKGKYSAKTLVRALGLKSPVLGVEHKLITLQRGDVILICTDGMTDSVPGWTLKAIVAGVKITSTEEIAANLTRTALSHGSMDNISVVVMQATDKPTEGPPTAIYDSALPIGSSLSVGPSLGWLTFLDGERQGQVLSLEASTVIGADPRCKIVLKEDFVSNRHAEIFRSEHGFMIRDLGSTNGTFINNIKTKEAFLVDGDMVRVGCTEMIFKSHACSVKF